MMENKIIVRNYLESVWSKKNYSAIDEFIAEDYRQHIPGIGFGREGIKDFFALVDRAFRGVIFQLDDLIGEADRVCFRFRVKGEKMDKTELGGIIGYPFNLTGISMVRMENGKMAEAWGTQEIQVLHREPPKESLVQQNIFRRG